jgi:hypothetical protein
MKSYTTEHRSIMFAENTYTPVKGKGKVKISLLQAMEAHTVTRG